MSDRSNLIRVGGGRFPIGCWGIAGQHKNGRVAAHQWERAFKRASFCASVVHGSSTWGYLRFSTPCCLFWRASPGPLCTRGSLFGLAPESLGHTCSTTSACLSASSHAPSFLPALLLSLSIPSLLLSFSFASLLSLSILRLSFSGFSRQPPTFLSAHYFFLVHSFTRKNRKLFRGKKRKKRGISQTAVVTSFSSNKPLLPSCDFRLSLQERSIPLPRAPLIPERVCTRFFLLISSGCIWVYPPRVYIPSCSHIYLSFSPFLRSHHYTVTSYFQWSPPRSLAVPLSFFCFL